MFKFWKLKTDPKGATSCITFNFQIADFGLARSVEDEEYQISSNTKLPVRWMSVEAIQHHTYTNKSDV